MSPYQRLVIQLLTAILRYLICGKVTEKQVLVLKKTLQEGEEALELSIEVIE